MPHKYVLYEKKGDIGCLTLNRPDKLNALDDDLLNDLSAQLLDIEPDIDVKVIVIKGAGDSFCSGQDLGAQGTMEVLPNPKAKLSAKELLELERRKNRRWEYIFNFPKVTIAQVHGYCLGAGLYLAMCCDLAFAAEDAVLGDPGARMGLVTPIPLWNWYVGLKKAKEILYLGRYISGKEAAAINLINGAVPRDRLAAEVERYAQAISYNPGDGLIVAKENINANLDMQGLGETWRLSTEMQLANALRLRNLPRDEFNFFEVRDQQGIDKAVEQRDAPFKGLV